MNGIVEAVCISEKKGTAKQPVEYINLIEGWGVENDSHAGKWHRQVSLLCKEKVDEFNLKGGNVLPGDFGENILVSGIDFRNVPVWSIVHIGDVILRMTQVGKECHTSCEIFKRVGECIMPKEGVFAEVLKGGTIKPRDKVIVELPDVNRKFTAAVITVSDKGFKNERIDESGPTVKKILEENNYEVVYNSIIPDEINFIKRELIQLSDKRKIDLIITTGGTGFSSRDVTPEATMEIMEKNAFGICEYMRMKSSEITEKAILSRCVSVIRNSSLIINLPGSPIAAKENLEFVLNPLNHGLKVLRGEAQECARRKL